eukprot:TRINITY_DN10448_c0_g1_i1.p1 TRINITY_DN10448_c0_g1~~TRINITY_DN10448_c0_g1_i1.p1  ORF type:complete len:218 (+),score=25.04 TRINITY_DN10448_c0_g1_i1:31-684(+)
MKANVRSTVNALLRQMSVQDVKRESEAIQIKILSSPLYKRATRIAVYLNLTKEVGTRAIIEDILRSDSGKVCFVPDIVPDPSNVGETKMRMVRLYSMDDLATFAPKSLGVLSPPTQQSPTSIQQREDALDGGIDLFLMPGLAFDRECRRLGRGKAYYDHYIRDLKALCATNNWNMPPLIGLSLSTQIIPEVPTEPHDQVLDLIVTAEADYGKMTLNS